MELARWGWRGKWKWEEAERGKWEEGKFSAKILGRTEMKQSSNHNNSACSGCDNALVKGPTVLANLRTCHWVTSFEWWKQLKWVFTFAHSHPIFESLNHENDDPKLHPNKCASVGPTSFGWWKQKTEWYHSILWVSKQALKFYGKPKPIKTHH